MGNSLSKYIQYRGYRFNISINLYVKCEGERIYHDLIVKGVNFDYEDCEMVNNKFLMVAIKDHQRYVENYINEKIDSKISIEEQLENIGFK